MKQDIYKILGVEKSASIDEIRARYLALTRENHPDRYHTAEEQRSAEQRFQDITEAYNILKNPRLRREYDKDYGKSEQILSGEEAERFYKIALRHINDKKYYEAVQMLEQAIKLRNDDGRFYNELAKVQLNNPNWLKKAEQNSFKAVSLDGFNYDFKLTLGKVYLSAKLRSRAIKLITEALDLKPGDKEGLELLDRAKAPF